MENDGPKKRRTVREKLSLRALDRIEPVVGRDLFVWDSGKGSIPGLALRVRPSGARTWIFRYREGGLSLRVTIGSPPVWTPEMARERAKELAGRVAAGESPAREGAERRATPTVEQFFGRWCREWAAPRKKASSIEGDRLLFREYVSPRLGSRKLTEVTRGDVARLHAEVGVKRTVSVEERQRAAEERRAALAEKGGASGRRILTPQRPVVRGGQYVANRCLALLSALFSHADRLGFVPEGTNPCRRVERFKEVSRERFLSADELAALGTALALAERNATTPRDASSDHAGRRPLMAPPAACDALRMLVLTGARLREVLNLKWEHVDWESGFLRLPDSKTGAKNVPLGAPALELLKRRRASAVADPGEEPRGFVFPSDRRPERPFADLHCWRRIAKAAGLEGLRVHDLRHAFASAAVNGGENLRIIAALLGHRSVRTTEKYAHAAASPVLAAADRIATALDNALEGKKPAEVVGLSPRGRRD